MLGAIAIAAGVILVTMDASGKGSFAQKTIGMPTKFSSVALFKDDLAALVYTSGTTGQPKGAMLTQGNLLSNSQVLTTEWAFTASDILLHALPIFHTHGRFVATNIALLASSKVLFLNKFDLDKIINLLAKATTMMGVPTFYTRLLSDPRFTKRLNLAYASVRVRQCPVAHRNSFTL